MSRLAQTAVSLAGAWQSAVVDKSEVRLNGFNWSLEMTRQMSGENRRLSPFSSMCTVMVTVAVGVCVVMMVGNRGRGVLWGSPL